MVSTVYHTEHGDFLEDTLGVSSLTKKEMEELESVTVKYECPYTGDALKKKLTDDMWGTTTVTFPASYPEYPEIDISLEKELPHPEAFEELEDELSMLYRIRETGEKYSDSQLVNVLFSTGFERGHKVLLYGAILSLALYSGIMLLGYADLDGPLFFTIGLGLLVITSFIGMSRRYAMKFILEASDPPSSDLFEYEDLFKHFLFEEY